MSDQKSFTASEWSVGDTHLTHDHPDRRWCTYVTSEKGLVGKSYGMTSEEAKANARLQSAAPRLLAFVEAIAGWEVCPPALMHADYVLRDNQMIHLCRSLVRLATAASPSERADVMARVETK
jgi:hypothetical protein